MCLTVLYVLQSSSYSRDVKPSNVLIKQCGNITIPKLCDFGLCKEPKESRTGASTGATKSVETDAGTPGYRAPEVRGAEGKEYVISNCLKVEYV